MRVSLVTVNFNGAEKTIRLLDSLRSQTDQNFDVIVVDNASSSHDFRKLKQGIAEHFSSARLIQNSRNLGFSGGNNTGIKYALQNGAQWVVLINNDTWVESDFISRLGAFLEHSDGLVGIPMLEGTQLAYCGKIKWLKGTLPHLYTPPKTDNLARNSYYAIGGGVAIHKSVFEKIGYWDERYFLYFEDADFSMRAYKAGIKISVAASGEQSRTKNIALHHEVSGTTKSMGAPLLLRYHARNALLFNYLRAPWHIKIALPFLSILAIIYEVLKIIVMPAKRSENIGILAGIFDFYVRKFGKI